MEVCRLILMEAPKRLIVASSRRETGEAASAKLRAQFPEMAAEIHATFGNIFVRADLKDTSKDEILANPAYQKLIIGDVLSELSDEIVSSSFLFQLFHRYRPDIVVDCINTATAFAYQDIYRSAHEASDLLASSDDIGGVKDATRRLLLALYIPQLLRHIQILHESMRRVGTSMYVKVGTTGTGGMGLNIAYTHGEEKPSNDVKQYIQACHERGLEFSYLLNAPCLGNLQYSKRGYGKLVNLLEWIDESGADSVTVGIPYLVDLVRKRFPRLKIKISTTARVNTVRKALQYEAMGVEEIIIDEHINREFKTLEAIRKAVRCNLELIVNNICLWQCPYNYEHVNHDGHASRDGEDEYCYLQYPGYLCLYRKLTEPVELLKSPWIRPEDIPHYEDMGYDHFKITERFKRTPLLLEHVRAYERRRHDGNLLDLFTLPRKGAFTPVHLEYFIKPKHVNIMKVPELRKVFDLEVRELIHLDNSKLDGFIEHFKTNDCNQTPCSGCGYCETVFKRAVVLKDEELRRAAQRVRDFSEKLTSGEIFEIPKSHVMFRIPLFKSLLKRLLTWRLEREQDID